MNRFLTNCPRLTGTLLLATAMIGLIGCGASKDSGDTTSSSGGATAEKPAGNLSGSLNIDGSSTVYPVAQAMVEDFSKANPGVKSSANQAGTTAGMGKFLRGEIDIADASRPITKEEDAQLKSKGIDYIEIPMAFDGLSIVVNNKNTWLNSITLAELKKAWAPDSTVKNWSDIRAGFPNKPIVFYGPDTSHGTFDYFTEAVVGKKDAQRKDYQKTTEYNALVQGVSSDEGAMGYVGYSYYIQSKDKIKAVPVDAGKGPVAPNDDTILNGTYSPLSRPLFMYVSKKSYDSKPEVKAFVAYVLGDGLSAVKENNYVPLPDDVYKLVRDRVKAEKTGSSFIDFVPGTKISDALSKK